MKAITVYGGTVVRIRPVPPHVYRQLEAATRAEIPPPPSEPMREVKSAAGHTETHPAVEGTPEYEAWRVKFDKWAQENAGALETAKQRLNNRMMDRAVVSWRRKAGWLERLRSDSWQTQPPDSWKLPEDIETTGNRRIDYILCELVTTPNSHLLLFLAINSQDLTEQEVEAQLAGF